MSVSRGRVRLTDAEQHRRQCRDVVARIRDARLEPAAADRFRRERLRNPVAENHDAPDHEHDVDQVEVADRERQESLDGRGTVEKQDARQRDHADRADQLRQAEQAVRDLARGRAHDRQDDHQQQQVRDLEQEPAAPEQQLEERPVVVAAGPARQLEADHQHGAPEKHADQHAEQATPGPGREEELDELPAGRVASGDDRRFEHEPGQQIAAEPVAHESPPARIPGGDCT